MLEGRDTRLRVLAGISHALYTSSTCSWMCPSLLAALRSAPARGCVPDHSRSIANAHAIAITNTGMHMGCWPRHISWLGLRVPPDPTNLTMSYVT
eukprot:294981-Chlamydomonas_euryale.AAC.1